MLSNMSNINPFDRINSYFNNSDSKAFDGLSYSADSLFISSRENKKRLIVVDSNTDGERLYRELDTFNQNIADNELIFIPGTEEMPYDMVDSDKYLSSKKNLGLMQLINSKSTKLTVITTIKNLQKKLIPKNDLIKETIYIEKDIELDVEGLRKKLTNMGYLLNPQVNFHGEFSIRGSIIDIYAGGYEYPIRIDLNDINIESIRCFNVDSQITTDEEIIGKICIVPIGNIICNDENVITFRKKYREIFEGNPNTSNIYTSISNQIIPQGFNNYFPLLYSETNSLFEYFIGIDDWIIFDSIFNRLTNNCKTISDKFNYIKQNEELFLEPKKLYIEENELLEKIHGKKPITLYKDKTLSSNSYNFNVSSVPDISIKPYLEKPINDLLNHIDSSKCVILFSTDNIKISQFEDIFSANHLEYKKISSLKDININEHKFYIIDRYINSSFKINDLSMSFIVSGDIIKEKIKQHTRKKNAKSSFFIDQLKNLEVGAPVVHEEHGVGRYDGLKYLETNGVSNEYLTILYEENDKLYVPVSSLHLVNKYNTSDDEHAPLHKLGGFSWSGAKKKATKKAYDIAAELLEINAKRALRKTLKYNINEFEYDEFVNEFIYDETDDQLNAIKDVEKDLTSEKLMDRLVCGDVGFGKTEIALRAAFICASNFKQVVILAPTTLLAEQHEKTFKARFKNWPFKISCLSRFKTKKELDKTISEIGTGNCNIIIGTHRVIQKDIKFKSLGLLIIDEEQKFGVKHKEFLKKIKNEVNVLTLTATPIPRTLNLSLGGLRDLSIIATSPENRKPIYFK